MKNKTKITVKHFGLKHSSEVEAEAPVGDIIDAFCLTMIAAGWHRATIDQMILEKADAIRYERQAEEEE